MVKESKRLTLAEGAKQLGVSVFTVRKLLKERKLSGYKIGGRFWLDPGDIESYLTRNRITAKEDRRAQ
jgi:excisionase family DNA binding protein